jgi:hypothetical protein
MQHTRTPSSTLVGIALIVLPLVGLGLKFFSFGWMMVAIIFGPIFVMAIGYVIQIVIAIQGFLSRRDLFGAARGRATLAAWISLAGIVLLGLFMPDGGDVGYGSTLQVWLGAYGENGAAVNDATDTLTMVLAWISAVAWIGGFLWLATEWVGALARRGRERRAQH